MAAPRDLVRAIIADIGGGRDITRGYVDMLNYIQPEDRILRTVAGGNYQVYEEILTDDQVKSTFAQRRNAILTRDYQVLPGGDRRRDKAAAEHLAEMLEHVQWDDVTEKMLYSRFYGFGVAEAVWVMDGRHVTLDHLYVRNRRRFVFDSEFRLRLLTFQDMNGEIMPDKKFWTIAAGADNDDEPYGLGLAHHLYWPVWFKRNLIKFWLVAADRFGVPSIYGKYHPNAGDDEIRKLLDALGKIRNEARVAIPESTDIGTLDATRGTFSFDALYDRLNAAISKINVGQTMTTDDGSSRSQADVHMRVQKELIIADDKLINVSFTRGIGRWLTDWNYPGAAYPIVRRITDEQPDLEAQAKRDKTIVDMTGRRLDEQYVEDTYDVTLSDERVGAAPAAPEPEPGAAPGEEPTVDMGEGTDDDIDRALGEITPADYQDMMDPIIQPLLQYARSDPENFLSGLAELYPQLDADELEQKMARVIFAADAYGRLVEPDG